MTPLAQLFLGTAVVLALLPVPDLAPVLSLVAAWVATLLPAFGGPRA